MEYTKLLKVDMDGKLFDALDIFVLEQKKITKTTKKGVVEKAIRKYINSEGQENSKSLTRKLKRKF